MSEVTYTKQYECKHEHDKTNAIRPMTNTGPYTMYE